MAKAKPFLHEIDRHVFQWRSLFSPFELRLDRRTASALDSADLDELDRLSRDYRTCGGGLTARVLAEEDP